MANNVATAEARIAAPAGQVWQALTDPESIREWMSGSDVRTTWNVGGPITWTGEYDGHAYQDKGQVIEFDPPRRLVVTHYSPLMGGDDVPENYHRVSYDLTEVDGATTITLRQDGNDSAQQAEQFSANWQRMLDRLREIVLS